MIKVIVIVRYMSFLCCWLITKNSIERVSHNDSNVPVTLFWKVLVT